MATEDTKKSGNGAKRPNIMVVEREPHFRFTLSMALEAAGYAVSVKESDTDALHSLAGAGNGSVDLIVVSFDMDHLEDVRFIDLARELCGPVPCLVMYSLMDRHDLEKILADRECPRIERPFRMMTFLNAIDDAIHRGGEWCRQASGE
jgi:CheY-like chemotaxis protein